MSYAPPKECKTLRVTQLNACRVNTTDLKSTTAVIEDLVLSGDMTARNLSVEYLVAEDLAVANLPILNADGTAMRLLDVTNDSVLAQVNQSEILRFASTSINVGLSKLGTTTSVTLELPPQPLIRTGTYVPSLTTSANSITPSTAIFSLVDQVMTISGTFNVFYPIAGDFFTVDLPLPPDYTNVNFAVLVGSCVSSGGGGTNNSKAVCCTFVTGVDDSTFQLNYTTTDRTAFDAGGSGGNIVGYCLTFAGVYN
jgi:hypothetical protein